MTDLQQKLDEQLAELNLQYLRRLQHELPLLQRQVLALDNNASWREQVSDLLLKFHTFAGSAGTFGLPKLGQTARQLELGCKAWLANQQPPTAAEFRRVAEILQQLTVTELSESLQPAIAARVDREVKGQAVIYLLEDDESAGNHVAQTLGSYGYEVHWFRDVGAINDGLAVRAPDAFIVDIELMHSEDAGLSFIQHLTAELQQIPMFVISCHDDFSHYLQAVRVGVAGFFIKPVNASALEARLQRALSLREHDAFRVLIVDDDVLLAQHYALVLQNAGLRAEILTEPAQIFTGLQQFRPDVILLDVHMPDCSGPELAQLIRLQDEWLGVPIIYLSAETDSERQLAVLIKAGDDFITKPIGDHALVVAVFARAQRARQLAEIMTKDSLTGLLQHAHIKERLAVELDRSQRHQQEVSVVMLDIDHFKKVNDSYGHLVGDQVITALANLLRQQLRKTDVIGRYGGEEFLIVLPECPLQHAFKVIEQIRVSFNRLPFVVAGHEFHCSFSAGIAIGTGSAHPDYSIEQADQALYQAKAQGRNRVLLATPS